jgi:hypothetical protein
MSIQVQIHCFFCFLVPIHYTEFNFLTGFYKCYLSHKPYVRYALEKAQIENPDYAVIFTGHSLGAAQATLAAVDFVLNEDQPLVQV